jgi:hypothetical protein
MSDELEAAKDRSGTLILVSSKASRLWRRRWGLPNAPLLVGLLDGQVIISRSWGA